MFVAVVAVAAGMFDLLVYKLVNVMRFVEI